MCPVVVCPVWCIIHDPPAVLCEADIDVLLSQVAKEKAEKEEAEADAPDPSVRSICNVA